MMSKLQESAKVSIIDLAADYSAADTGDILLCTSLDNIDQQAIQRLPKSVGLIANLGVGVDHIDLVSAERHGILISNTPVVTEDTADLTWALILASCRRLYRSEQLLRDNQWGAAQSELGIRVHGKKLGIIGMGAIGQAVARRAKGFDMEILYCGPNAKPEIEDRLGAKYRTQEQLLGESDIVSLHCPLTTQSRHLINKASLELLKPTALLINTGRGGLINEASLVTALEHNKLAGAGLDVFEFEPNVTPDLKRLENVTLLPHIGSATGECRADMAARALANIHQYLNDNSVIDPVRT